jgi:hypothetical protein
VVNFTPRPPYLPGKNPVRIEEEAGWAPELVWTFWRREKISFETVQLRTLDNALRNGMFVVGSMAQ